MRVKQIAIGLLLFSAVAIVYFIVNLSNKGKKQFKEEKETNSYVVEVYQGYKGKPNYKVMLLADSQTFTVPKKLLYTLQNGDSVKKLKGNPYFEIKLSKTDSFEKVFYP